MVVTWGQGPRDIYSNFRHHPKMSKNKNQKKKKLSNAPQRRRRGIAKGPQGLRLHANMLANPCSAQLYPGFNGTDEGIISRLKTLYTGNSGLTNGFVLWSPIYVGGATHFNCFIYAISLAGSKGINSVAAPLGAGASGLAIDTAATVFVHSATVSDFRLISACLRVTYTGPLQSSQGLLASVENLPADTFLHGQATSDEVASVDDLFALSSKTQRFGVNTHELRYRPRVGDNGRFKPDQNGTYTLGTPGTSRTTLTQDSKSFGTTLFGFAWKGIASDQLSFEFVQNIEWRPETRAGFVSSIPRQITPAGYSQTVLAWMDRTMPGWTTALSNGASTIVSASVNRLASSVFSGVPSSPMLM